MRTRTLIVIAAIIAIPATTWAAFKPIRVVAPELLGLYCENTGICIDDPSLVAEATILKRDAASFVESHLAHFHRVPRIIFCSSAKCAKSFGFTNQAAFHLGTSGIVVGPRGWQPHIVRHELIHHVQMENIGSVHALLFTPTWFIEGMAYSLSEDPRHPLPAPLEAWRSKFERWYPTIESGALWSAAKAL